jgi:hypothetical protein
VSRRSALLWCGLVRLTERFGPNPVPAKRMGCVCFAQHKGSVRTSGSVSFRGSLPELVGLCWWDGAVTPPQVLFPRFLLAAEPISELIVF